MRQLLALCAVWLCACVGMFAPPTAQAGTLKKTDVQALYPPPMVVGEKLKQLPVWPVFRHLDGGLVLINHVFETIDLEPAPGYVGKPINLLVVTDANGVFVTSRLFSHNEPIFRTVPGTAKLNDFSQQYVGITVQHPVQILGYRAERIVTPNMATFHGVLAGTVTATAIDRSVMESAAQVAQMAQMQQATGTAASAAEAGAQAAAAAVPSGPDEKYQRTGFNGLVGSKLIQRWTLDHRELERAFQGGPGAGRDAQALIRPQAPGVDLWLSFVGMAQAGRNLLQAPRWQEVRALREQGQHVLMVLDGGRYSFTLPGSQTAGGGPVQRGVELSLHQGARSFAMQPLPWKLGQRMAGHHSGVATDATTRYYAIQKAADGTLIDIYQPVQMRLNAWRSLGDGDNVARASFERSYAIPNAQAYVPATETPRWVEALNQRIVDVVVLVVALVLLTVALVAQRRTAASKQRLQRFRIAFMVFTLGFIGWYAQGQLTVVSITAAVEALVAGSSLDFLLADPMAVVLWAFTFVTLVVWGRGTFCGWLCPFGALQELLALGARALGVAQKRFRVRTDLLLKRVKYAVLFILVGVATVSSAWTEHLVEVEPFKTSISLYFQRDWPYLLWAVLCLGVGTVVYRGYCRYVCPLGAALAVLGRLRGWGWIPRKAECGTPCQTCRHRCEYEAIEPSGKVDYTECFQCLDCVQTHDDDKACLPLVLKRTGKVIPVRMVTVAAKEPT